MVWSNFERPIIGLAPMDGITDAAFRYMVCKYGKTEGESGWPDLVITEFTNVEGLARGARKMMTAFKYSGIERPIIGQIYGVEVESFYKATVMLCALGFDGVDINMGCPANKVARKGSGAGLIKTPELAKKIIFRCKDAVRDWSEGITLEKAGLHPEIIDEVLVMRGGGGGGGAGGGGAGGGGWLAERRVVPVSVKTRTGYEKDIAEEWVKHLVEAKPAAITMHGRTLRQMYLGKADWDAVKRAGKIVRELDDEICFLGNGDVESMDDAREKIKKYQLNGVLVGRATLGNPWFFSGRKDIFIEERFAALREHCRIFLKLMPEVPFHHIKKHLAWYCKGFDGARDLRMRLMQTESSEDVIEIIKKYQF